MPAPLCTVAECDSMWTQVERQGEEVAEEVYEKYGELITIPSSSLEREYRSYHLVSLHLHDVHLVATCIVFGCYGYTGSVWVCDCIT